MNEPPPAVPSDIREESGSEESFENAIPAALRPSTGDGMPDDESAAGSRPALDEVLARAPPTTKDALKKLFLIEPTEMKVREIRPENLR